jgi:hypothetical protein
MSTIYITPFRRDTLQATAASADSGFTDLASAIASMAPTQPVRQSERTAVFHTSEADGIFFSHYKVSGPAKNLGGGHGNS